MSSQSEAAAVNDALKEPAPHIRESESLTVTLQRGLVDPVSGLWQTEAEVREMTGADEEYMAGIDARETITYSEYMATLLKKTVVRVGTINISEKQSMIDSLSFGDRDILFLGVIKATYGKTKEFRVSCPRCSEENDILMDLDEDFPINKPTVDLHAPIVIKLRNGKTVKLRIPTISDTAYVVKKAQNNSSQNTLMIAKCVIWDGDQPTDVEEWAKSLNLADRNKMVKALLDIKAGPSIEAVNAPCAHCREEMTIGIDWVSLLLS